MSARLFRQASSAIYRARPVGTRSLEPVFTRHHFAALEPHPTTSQYFSRCLSTSTESDPPEVSTYTAISEAAADYMQSFHDVVSYDVLPWSATLPLAALSIRVITFPVVYHSQLHAGRAALASKELPKIHHFVRTAPGTLWQKYRTFRRLRMLTLRAAGTSPVHQFPWHVAVHLPLLISTSLGVRLLAARAPIEWQTAGPPFATDLLAADPTGALPVITTALWLWNVDPRMDARRKASNAVALKQSERSRVVDMMMRRIGETFTTGLQMVIVMSLTVTTSLPAGVILFWASNAFVTLTQRFILSCDSVRTRLGLPTMADIVTAPGSNLMPAVEQSMEELRKELSYIQQRMLVMFPGRSANDELCAEVNRMLKRERWNGRVAADLEAVLRKDERDGKQYVAIVRRGASDL